MVVMSRIRWLLSQFQEGRPGRIAIRSNASGLTLKVTLDGQGAMEPFDNAPIIALLSEVEATMMQSAVVAVDHGHRHSSGMSVVTISVRAPTNVGTEGNEDQSPENLQPAVLELEVDEGGGNVDTVGNQVVAPIQSIDPGIVTSGAIANVGTEGNEYQPPCEPPAGSCRA